MATLFIRPRHCTMESSPSRSSEATRALLGAIHHRLLAGENIFHRSLSHLLTCIRTESRNRPTLHVFLAIRRLRITKRSRSDHGRRRNAHPKLFATLNFFVRTPTDIISFLRCSSCLESSLWLRVRLGGRARRPHVPSAEISSDS